VPENEQFWFGTVLSFGDKAKILEPPEIINKVVDTCNLVINQYEKHAL
jgi:predicted DNA-binding transcriptional regulator YafY